MRALLNDPVFIEIMDEMEQTAMNDGVYAGKTDDETRAAAMAEVRAIRALRSKLSSIIQDDETANRRKGSIA